MMSRATSPRCAFSSGTEMRMPSSFRLTQLFRPFGARYGPERRIHLQIPPLVRGEVTVGNLTRASDGVRCAGQIHAPGRDGLAIASGEGLTIGTECQGGHRSIQVGWEQWLADQPGRVDIPQQHLLVVTGGCDQAPVRTERDGRDGGRGEAAIAADGRRRGCDLPGLELAI